MWELCKRIWKWYWKGKESLVICLVNNAELRAGGGFITKVFSIRKHGIQCVMHSHDVFGDLSIHTPVDAPIEVQQFLYDSYLQSWTLRDALQFSSLSENIEAVKRLFEHVFPTVVVGDVVLIDLTVIERLLRVLGPVRCGGQLWTEQTVFYKLTAEVSDIDRHDTQERMLRKHVLISLAKGIIKATLQRPWKLGDIWKVVGEMIAQKHVQYEGSWELPHKNFLRVELKNYLGMKSNRFIRVITEHVATVSASELQHVVAVTLEHRGGDDEPVSGFFRGVLSIVVPDSVFAVLPLSTTLYGVKEGHGYKKVSFYIELKPGSKVHLPLLSYRDSRSEVISWVWSPQPGGDHQVLLSSWTNKDGLQIINNEGTLRDNVVFFSTRTNMDTKLVLRDSDNIYPLRIVGHEWVNPLRIIIRFNRELADIQLDQVLVYHKETRASIEIREVFIHQKQFHVIVEDQGCEPGFYTVELRDIVSVDGRKLRQSPRLVTVKRI